jgi:hypothetical protein
MSIDNSTKGGMVIFATVSAILKDKRFEAAFIAVFSVLIFVIFYVLISMNGIVLGNDPAVHLEKAMIFLNTGEISLANLGWTPPLYQIILAMFIALSGANDIAQFIFLVKVVAVICDWLLVFSAYLIASRFFDKRVGVVACILLLMCFPMFEANQFGGYTTVLALAYMLLVFLYTPLAVEKFGYLIATFFVAFGLVLSHQLAAFLAFFIMPPILLYMLIKSKGKYLKVVAAITVGGGAAFILYYAAAMLPYLGYIGFVFFGIKTYAYQIPATTLQAFNTNFGFIAVLGAIGVVVAGYQLMKKKQPLLTLIVMLSFFVPLFFTESYYFGFYLPFGWFVYYIMPPLIILAAVSTVFFADKATVFHVRHRSSFKKNWVKALTVVLVVLLAAVVVQRADVVYGRILQGSVYYSTTDTKAYDAGVWLKENYRADSTVVVTYIPGFWFQEFSGMHVIAQTDPAVQRNEIAEAVLSLSYELDNIEHTMVRAYEAKGDIMDDTYVYVDQVWDHVAYSSGSGDFLNYTLNGASNKVQLSSLSHQTSFFNETMPKKIVTFYSNEDIELTRTISVGNDTYAITTSWIVTPLKNGIDSASLYITSLFDLKYTFSKAQVPGVLDWVNPWDAPDQIKEQNNSTELPQTNWAVASFTSKDLTKRYVGVYDDKNNVAFAINFTNLPTWCNIGALGNGQIDAIRFQYDFPSLEINQSAGCNYQTLTLSRSSYPILSPDALQGIFDLRPSLTINGRTYIDYIAINSIEFVVYDRNQLDTSMIHSRLLQLIYSNDRYVIFKIVN